jgi:hypothetical protein
MTTLGRFSPLGDEIHPWMLNGELRPFAVTHGVLAEGPLIR